MDYERLSLLDLNIWFFCYVVNLAAYGDEFNSKETIQVESVMDGVRRPFTMSLYKLDAGDTVSDLLVALGM